MDPALQLKIITDHPLLYADKDKSIYETAICWGLDIGDGWYSLLYKLSDNLEKEIERFMEENEPLRCTCGHEKRKHFGSKMPSPGKCLTVDRVPTKWRRSVVYSSSYLIRFFQKIYNNIKNYIDFRILGPLLYSELETCFCDRYESTHPRASQVKEKFGMLRVYLTQGTNKMFDLIEEAEDKSMSICETCSKPGKQNNEDEGYWIRTLCETHWEERRKE